MICTSALGMLSSHQPAPPPACLALPGPPTLAATFPGIDLHQLSEISHLSPCAARPQPHSVLSRTCSSVPVHGVGETEGHFKGAQSCKRSMHLGNALCCDDSVSLRGLMCPRRQPWKFPESTPSALTNGAVGQLSLWASASWLRNGEATCAGLAVVISWNFMELALTLRIFILTYTYVHYLLPLLLIICLLIIR